MSNWTIKFDVEEPNFPSMPFYYEYLIIGPKTALEAMRVASEAINLRSVDKVVRAEALQLTDKIVIVEPSPSEQPENPS